MKFLNIIRNSSLKWHRRKAQPLTRKAPNSPSCGRSETRAFPNGIRNLQSRF